MDRAEEVGEHDEPVLPGQGGQVLGQHVAHHLVQGPVDDRHARAPLLEQEPPELRGRRIARKRHHAAAGDHDLSCGEVPEGQGPRGDLGRGEVEGSRPARLLDELLELLRGEPRLGEGGPVAEGPQHQVGAGGEEPGQRADHAGQEQERPPGQQGVALRAPQGQRLGDELSQHQRQEGDQRHHQREGDGPGVRRQPRDRRDDRGDALRELGAAEGRGSGAHHGDADLDRGDESLRGAAQLLHGARPRAPLFHELGQPAPPQGDDRDLRPGEGAVGQDQRQHHQELGDDLAHALSSRSSEASLLEPRPPRAGPGGEWGIFGSKAGSRWGRSAAGPSAAGEGAQPPLDGGSSVTRRSGRTGARAARALRSSAGGPRG